MGANARSLGHWDRQGIRVLAQDWFGLSGIFLSLSIDSFRVLGDDLWIGGGAIWTAVLLGCGSESGQSPLD
jgi:hypothetical protein